MDALLLHSPVGLLLVEYAEEGVGAVRFWSQGDHPPARTRHAASPGDRVGRQVERELREYFAGDRREFSVPLLPAGTPFQLRVRDALRRIPWGEVRSYAELAVEIGVPGGARAVGQANGSNPLPLIVPCHRVVAAGRKLGGYGGGPDRKRWLLAHEGVQGLRGADGR